GAAHIGVEVLGLVVEAAVVEVGKLAEDHYPQVRQVFDVGRYMWPPEQFDVHLESLAGSRVTPAAMPARKRELIMRANPPLATLRKELSHDRHRTGSGLLRRVQRRRHARLPRPAGRGRGAPHQP